MFDGDLHLRSGLPEKTLGENLEKGTGRQTYTSHTRAHTAASTGFGSLLFFCLLLLLLLIPLTALQILILLLLMTSDD